MNFFSNNKCGAFLSKYKKSKKVGRCLRFPCLLQGRQATNTEPRICFVLTYFAAVDIHVLKGYLLDLESVTMRVTNLSSKLRSDVVHSRATFCNTCLFVFS